MAVPPHKRSNTLLYVNKSDIHSQRIKMVIAEKHIPLDIIEINPQETPEDFIKLNPHRHTPFLIDRDLTLHDPNIISEYLDERFPHPPLLPVYPIARAKTRAMVLRLEREWYLPAKIIKTSSNEIEIKNHRKLLAESIISFSPVFSALPYFLSDEFSMLDCCVAPILWHLPSLGIQIPPQTQAIQDYAQRIFQRPCFQASLKLEPLAHENA